MNTRAIALLFRPTRLLLLGGLLLARGSLAEEPNADPMSETNFVQEAHAKLSKQLVETADAIDKFFGDREYESDHGESWLRLTTSGRLEEQMETALRAKVKARLALPNLEEEVQLFFESFSEDPDLEPDATATEIERILDTTEESSFFTGLRYAGSQEGNWRFSTDAGLRLNPEPDPFVRVRAKRNYHFDPFRLRFTQYGNWRLEDGFGETTRIDLDRLIGKRHLLRFTSKATWSEESQGVDLLQKIKLSSELSALDAVSLDTTMESHTHPEGIVDRYVCTFIYKHRLKNYDWMYVSIEPEAGFPDERDWKFTPAITVRLELLFGQYEDL